MSDQKAAFPLDDQIVTWRSRGYLPHLERDGAIYFVTFRLADALPGHVLASIRAEHQARLEKARAAGMLSTEEQDRLDLFVSRRIQRYLDAGKGACHLANPLLAESLAQTMRRFAGTRYRLFAWCIMPNHVHAVMQPLKPATLSTILHSWKSFAANVAQKQLGVSGPLWQREYYDHLIRNDEALWRIMTYVAQNPLKASLSDWRWVEVNIPQEADL
jgi:REP element-mobilizing transposase RayT